MKDEIINKSRRAHPRAGAGLQPFAELTPEQVLEAAEVAGLEPDGRLLALNSYENRVYRLGTVGGFRVLKFYRPGRWSDGQILEEHAFAAELTEGELPVAAPLEIGGHTLIRQAGFRFAAFECLAGREPELDAPGARERLGRTLARIHQVGARAVFARRPAIDVERYGQQAQRVVLASALLPEALTEQYTRLSDQLLQRIERVYEEVAPVRTIRVHGDCHLGNLLWAEQGPRFVDLDDCAMAPRIQDLWMLLSGEPAEQQAQWAELMAGYEQFASLDYHELRLIEPLRALRMLHHAAWVCERWTDPAFPRAFPWFGEGRHWEGYLRDLAEQLSAIDEPPLLAR
ncbi:MAG: serine/threonine protein kinase [Steroidobacteraceae bacterium]